MTTLLGQKLGMTQIFAPDGATVAVTLINVPRAYVTQIKTAEKDGYQAVQVGSSVISDLKKAQKKISKPGLGHLRKSNKWARKLYEYRATKDSLASLKVGDEIKLDQLKSGEAVKIKGVSKGRGFAGVVKRHHFKGGPASHGHKDNLRGPGSIGAQQPQHVWPGTRMGGHMGAEVVFVRNVEIIKADLDKRTVVVKGPLPGALHSWIFIETTGEKSKYPISDRKAVQVVKKGGKDKTNVKDKPAMVDNKASADKDSNKGDKK